MTARTLLVATLLLHCAAVKVYCQQPTTESAYVSRQEYDRLRGELDELKAQMREIATSRSPSTGNVLSDNLSGPSLTSDIEPLSYQPPQDRDSPTDLDQVLEGFQRELAEARQLAKSAGPGTTHVLIRGFGVAEYVDSAHEKATFGAEFAPVFLFRVSDRIFFEASPSFELEDTETAVSLEFAQFSYLLNDCATIGVGYFPTPFGLFPERLEPDWINKLPAKPLIFDDEGGLLPLAELGVQLHGAIPCGPGKFVYAVYISNGPGLGTDSDEPESIGKLRFDNFSDINHGKAVGTRLAYRFNTEWEFGYSLQVARVGDSGSLFRKTDAVLQGMDVSYVKDSELLGGRIDARFEWAWSQVDDQVFELDPGPGADRVSFHNHRDGGYLQVAYRPLQSDCECLRNWEPVIRFDNITAPGHAPDQFNEQAWTLGLNYWLGPSTVIKLAYRFDNRDHGEKDEDTLFVQAVVGF
jgi:hypothetical protein